MQNHRGILFFTLFLASSLSVLFGQGSGLELDIYGRPFKVGITTLPPEDVELVPWLKADYVSSAIAGRLNRSPGVGTVMKDELTSNFRAMYRNGELPHYIKVSGRQYLLRMVVEDGGIIYRHTPDGKREKEINRYLNVRVSLINVATSRVDFVTRLHAEAKFKQKEAAAAKLKYPKLDVHTWPLYESLSEEVRKKVAPFFSHPTPIIEYVDGKGRYLNAVNVPGVGGHPKVMPAQIDIFRIKSTLETEYGNFYEFEKLAFGSVVKKTDFWQKVMYTIGWGKKKIIKELEAGGTVYSCANLDELR